TRVVKVAEDEIGDLTDNFNELMQTISNHQRIQEEAEKDLTEMTKELIKHNNELQRFAYITSHDLRAPVVNLVKLLEFVDRESLNNVNGQIFEKIRVSILKLNETLNDLIQVVSAQKSLNNEIEKINFDKFVKEVLFSIENQVKDSNAIIYTDWKVKEINYLRAHLNSIFINMITNAIKYRHPTRNPEIHIKTYLKDKYICIEFSDNGLGIDFKHNNKNNLFGLHKRFHTNIEGKGIGLFLIKTLVESLDGTVDAESELDKGTTFFIFLKDKV
ncbi:MAG: HAMP domain-containing sensor histidine kinase, partial [Cytophagales bacterium]